MILLARAGFETDSALILQVDEDEAASECVVQKREVRLQAFSCASLLTLHALNECSSCLVVEVCKRTSTYDLGTQPAAFVTDCVLAGAG